MDVDIRLRFEQVVPRNKKQFLGCISVRIYLLGQNVFFDDNIVFLMYFMPIIEAYALFGEMPSYLRGKAFMQSLATFCMQNIEQFPCSYSSLLRHEMVVHKCDCLNITCYSG